MPGAGGGSGRTSAEMSRRQLLEAAGIDDEELTELEAYGLIRRVGRQYGPEALEVARAVAALRQYGVQARHLRAVKAAADREANLVEQVVAPQLRQRDPGARDAAPPDRLADRGSHLAAARDAGRIRAGARPGWCRSRPRQPIRAGARPVGAGR